MKRYWHELSDSTIKKLISKGTSWRQVMDKYLQPAWCTYPDALEGALGCWSLTDHFGSRHKISIEFCKSCDCFKKVKK